MGVFHVVTETFSPSPGGLEAWTLRFSQWLASEGHRVIVYIYGDGADPSPVHGLGKVLLADERSAWEAPILQGGTPQAKARNEHFRLLTLMLAAKIGTEVARRPDDRHVLISNYLTGSGVIGANLASELSLPHLALAVGTDLARGMQAPSERAAVERVVRSATMVVTRNQSQESGLRRAFGVDTVCAIHSSLSGPLPEWNPPPLAAGAPIRLFSDCGYSSKKGTQVLLAAFGRLRQGGVEATLTLCGSIYSEERPYWDAWIGEHADYPGVELLPHLPLAEVRARIARSHLYCSATLSEGCSQARVAALCIGIPIVSTWSGEMIDVAGSADHLALATPADRSAFGAALESMCVRLRNVGVSPDHRTIEAWRTHFSPAREHRDWRAVLRDCFGEAVQTDARSGLTAE